MYDYQKLDTIPFIYTFNIGLRSLFIILNQKNQQKKQIQNYIEIDKLNNLHKQTKSAVKELKITSNDKEYKTYLELSDQKIKITLSIDFQPFKWSQIYSIEQIYKVHNIFLLCDTIEIAFEYLSDILQTNKIDIVIEQQQMILNISSELHKIKVNYQIKLLQEEINNSDAFQSLNQIIIGLQKRVEELELKSLSKEDQQKIQEQEKIINQQNEIIKNLQNTIEVVSKENQSMKQNIADIQDFLNLNINISNILKDGEVDKIRNWINEGNKNMNLKLLYRATTNGFQIEKFYEKCSNISSTLVLIKSTSQRRFGGYTELLWENNNKSIPSNPNKTFLFSLDLNKKYTSNNLNCNTAIAGEPDSFRFGSGSDLRVYSMSNQNQSSFTNPCSYGQNEGLAKDTLAGQYTFSTLEIEVFKVNFN